MQASTKLFTAKTPTFMQNEHQKPVFATLKELEAYAGNIQTAEDVAAFCDQAVKLFQAQAELARAKQAMATLPSSRKTAA